MLEKAENDSLLIKAKTDNNAMYFAVCHNVGLILNEMRKPFINQRIDMFDIFQEMCVSFIKAVRTWEPEKGSFSNKFISTYKNTITTQRLLMYYEMSVPRGTYTKNPKVIDQYPCLFGSNEIIDDITRGITINHENESSEIVKMAMEKVNDREKYVFELWMNHEKTFDEIGALICSAEGKHSITKERAHQIFISGAKKIKRSRLRTELEQMHKESRRGALCTAIS